MSGIAALSASIPSLSTTALPARLRRTRLHRIFSTFPAGLPGIGLLLLRVLAGGLLIAEGVACILARQQGGVLVLAGAALSITGASVLVGFLTPILSPLAALECIVISLNWLSLPVWNPLDSRLALLELAAIAIAVFLIGPGAFSIDARLFGWREIVIPPPDPPVR